MSAALTRRALMAGATAAAGAVGLPAAVAAETGIPVSDPDVGLLDLIARHVEADAEVVRLSVASDDAWRAALAAYPPRPDVLLWRPDDFPRTGFGHALADRGEDGRPWRYTARAAEWLAEREPFPAWAQRTGAAMSPAQAEASEARRLEIVTEWGAHSAERRAVHDRVGFTALCKAEDAAADLVVTLAAEIKRARPATLAGLRALAVWAGRQAEAGAAHDDLLALFAGTVAGFGVET